ncbi:MAG: hypothetical protein WA687_13035 [Solirubrobacterales bacterium]
MLDVPRYLLGVVEIALLVGFAGLAGVALRFRLLPSFSGAPGHLATAVLALAILVWVAELLGAFGLFEPVPYLVGVAVVGVGLRLGVGGGRGCPSRNAKLETERGIGVATLIALIVAAIAVIKFGLDVKPKLSTGMTGFDSTWYHGPFAAGFFQGGDTWGLHYIAPQFLAWFYPANAEIFHAVGMLAFGRDVLSPLLNFGWFVGCLVACWCIGRPYRVAPWSLALGAVALSLPVLSDQAGEARNDIVGIFFLLAAVAVALNAWVVRPDGERSISTGALLVAGLAAGLAAGTKLNFLLPAAVLVLGLAVISPTGRRWRALALTGGAALAGGGYWYLRNLVHSGNPLPWFDSLGPLSLPAPDQALGGREGHSVLGYLTDGAVWSDWFLPGLREGLTVLWPLLLVLALSGLLLSVLARNRDGDRALVVVGLTGLAAVLAWLIAPTSASGPEGMPRGFESGLRYLAPALVLGLALVPIALSARLREVGMGHPPNRRILKVPPSLGRHLSGRGMPHAGLAVLIVLLAIAIGYPVQRHYLENRYANPTFATPGLNAAFKWATPISDARIATTSTRQYPLYGTDLSNHVQYIGEEQPHGGFTAPTTCQQWRHLLSAGNYDYVVTSRDRIEPGKSPYPATTRWTEDHGATPILRTPPTVVFELGEPLDPSACP